MKVTYLSIWVKITNREIKLLNTTKDKAFDDKRKNRKTKAEMAGNYSRDEEKKESNYISSMAP